MSSRNRFLSADERAIAPRLHAILSATATALRSGNAIGVALAAAERDLTRAGFQLDYLALADALTMSALPRMASGARLIVAARLGSVRLIDNIAA